MKYLFIGLTALAGGAFYAFKSNKTIVASTIDNALIDTGVTDVAKISSSNKTLADRNNNPLNIRVSKDNWQGLAVPRSADGFFKFIEPAYGYRAAKQIILNAYKSRGIDTLKEIISTWAPSNENETDNYISFVSKKSGIGVNEKININNIADLFYAMTIIEMGKAHPMGVITKGLSL